MKVAVTNMADKSIWHQRTCEVPLGFAYAFCETRDRYADVRRPAFRSRSERQRRIIGVMTRPPQLRALFGCRRPSEISAAIFDSNRLHGFSLFGNSGRRPVKFEK